MSTQFELIQKEMGTNMNFKGFSNELSGVEGRSQGDFSLARQSSVYSLTFDEFQTTLGKDFGSMNMEELLKSIWSAEETQNVAASAPAASSVGSGVQDGGFQGGGYLQRQGSLSLPRTLSLKTVDEVWKDIAKEYGGGNRDTGNGPSIPQAQREPTLGEMTLEEFLVRAGVVREDNQLVGKPNPGGYLGDLAQPNDSTMGFGINFQQPGHGAGFIGSRVADNNIQISLQTPNLPLNVNGVRSAQHQVFAPQMPQQQQPKRQPQPYQQQQQQQPIFPKQATVSCAPAMAIPMPNTTQLASPGIRNGIVGMADPTINGRLTNGSAALQGCGLGIVGYGGAGIGVTAKSPASLSSDGLNSSGDTPSVSPGPYMFNGGLRGRKSNATVEKVVERRHRRMIKNRESAARSRQRKQVYTMELEQEVEKLKTENVELKKKQEEIVEMQKNQALEMMSAQYGAKKRCLRKTLSGPW